jgi:serine/threonine protein kinase
MGRLSRLALMRKDAPAETTPTHGGRSEGVRSSRGSSGDRRVRICVSCKRRFDGAVDVCPTDGAEVYELGDESDPRIGTTHYEFLFLDKLGEGGTSDVYLAYNATMKRKVAVKILRASHAGDPERAARFEEEAVGQGNLPARYVVSVFSRGRFANGDLYIEMEYVDGPSLDKILRDTGRLELDRACELFDQVCCAVESAHRKRVWHRDIKPSNIMISNDGEQHAKLADFGLVGREGRNLELTREGWLYGTPYIMAPEQWQHGRTGPWTDIYQLGILLHQMLTGRRPFEAKEEPELRYMHLEEKPSPPSAHSNDPRVHEFNRIVARCMNKDPNDRFPSVAQLRSEFAESVKVALPEERRPELPVSPYVRDPILADRLPGSTEVIEPRNVSEPISKNRGLSIALGLGFLAVSAASMSVALRLVAAPAGDSLRVDRPHALLIDSKPERGMVFIDGEPTGLLTPATIEGLPTTRAVHISVQKSGFRTADKSVTLAGSAPEHIAVELSPAIARVHFTNRPAGSRLWVDGVEVRAQDVRLPFGTRRFRLETRGRASSKGLIVQADEQTVDLGSEAWH